MKDRCRADAQATPMIEDRGEPKIIAGPVDGRENAATRRMISFDN
jgi:hypothetical protein